MIIRLSFIYFLLLTCFQIQGKELRTTELLSLISDPEFHNIEAQIFSSENTFVISSLEELVLIKNSFYEYKNQFLSNEYLALLQNNCNCPDLIVEGIETYLRFDKAIKRYYTNADYEDKLAELEAVLQSFKALDNFDLDVVKSIFYFIGNLHFSNKQYYKSRDCFQSAQNYSDDLCIMCIIFQIRADLKLEKLSNMEEQFEMVMQDSFVSNSLLWKNSLLMSKAEYFLLLNDTLKAKAQFELVQNEYKTKYRHSYLNAMSKYYDQVKNYKAKLLCHQNALAYCLDLPEKYPNTSKQKLRIAKTFIQLDQWDKANDFLNQTIDEAIIIKGDNKQIIDEESYVSAKIEICKYFLQNNNLEEAKKELFFLNEFISSKFSSLLSYKDKLNFVDASNKVFTLFHLFRKELNLSDFELLKLAEKVKSFALFDEIKFKENLSKKLSESEYQKILATKSAISEKEILVNKLHAKPTINQSDLVIKLKEINTLKSSLDSLLQLSDNSQHHITDQQIENLLSELSEHKTVLQFLVSDDYVTALTINDGSFFSHNLNISRELKDAILKYSSKISAFENINAPYDLESNLIYEALIAPIKDHLKENVIIIPDGILSSIPFETLLSKKKKFLIEDHNISYAYSLRILNEMSKKGNQAKGFLGFAPSFDSLNPLPYVGKELAAIEKEFSAPVSFYDVEATKEKFLEEYDEYSIIHIASHADINPYDNDYSYVAFADKEKEEGEYLLYLNQLYNLDLNTDMIVLSACNTGLGKYHAGEGILSIARGFVYAGTASVISTLWEIDDYASSEIMRTFYQGLGKTQTKDLALADAKRKYIRLATDKRKHPYYWAGFIAVGNMDAIEINNEIPGYIAFVLLLIILGAAYFIRKIGIKLY